MLTQNKVHMALKGTKPTNIEDEECQDKQVVALSPIRMCLADSVIYDVDNEKTIKVLWLKLKSLFMSNNFTNKLFMKRNLLLFWKKEVENQENT